MSDPVKLAAKALDILRTDEKAMQKIEDYYQGRHELPYTPVNADSEYRQLARKACTNWCDVLVTTPAQALYVDNYRRGGSDVSGDNMLSELTDSPEWLAWQNSRGASRQHIIHSEALKFGTGYVLNNLTPSGNPVWRGLSPFRTVTLYDDPAFDIDPIAAVYVKRWAKDDPDGVGQIIFWDDELRYDLTYKEGSDIRVVGEPKPHGASSCPVTRFYPFCDSEGNTWGVIERLFDVQDRINQTIFDLLVMQTYNSFEVRTATGMAPPVKRRMNEDGEYEVVLDSDGNPVPDRIELNASRFLVAEDPDVKFGSLPGGSLDGVIASAELAIRHLAALSQTPPHFLLGQIANVSAEALEAAETALARKVGIFRSTFGESWERVFRLAAEMAGEDVDDNYTGEVIWRDLGASSLAQSADALGKFAESLGVPRRGLWSRVPGVSRAELVTWDKLLEEDNYERQLVETAVGARAARQTTAPDAPTRFGQEATDVVATP